MIYCWYILLLYTAYAANVLQYDTAALVLTVPDEEYTSFAFTSSTTTATTTTSRSTSTRSIQLQQQDTTPEHRHNTNWSAPLRAGSNGNIKNSSSQYQSYYDDTDAVSEHVSDDDSTDWSDSDSDSDSDNHYEYYDAGMYMCVLTTLWCCIYCCTCTAALCSTLFQSIVLCCACMLRVY
jgi:hypothetical protein